MAEAELEQAPQVQVTPGKGGGGGGWILLLPGIVLLGGGGYLAASQGAAGIPPSLAAAGPFAALAGLFLLALSPLLSHLQRNARKLADLEEATEFLKEQDKAIRTSLADLNSIDVAAKLAQVASGMAPSEIKEALVRADEKISNLTKATRMFSQPLEELSKGVADLSERLEKAEDSLQEMLASTQTSAARLEEFAAALPARTAAETEEILSSRLPEILERSLQSVLGGWKERLDSLAGAFEEFRKAQAEGRTEFKEALEEGLADLRLALGESAQGWKEGLEQVLADLEEKVGRVVEEKTGPLREGLEEVRGRVESFHSGLDAVRQDLAGLGEKVQAGPAGSGPGGMERDPAVDQVLQILQGLERKVQDLSAGIPAGGPAPAPEPAHAVAGAPAQASGTPPPPPASPRPKPQGKGGGSVLSAIQKLKQMRGNG